MIPLQSYLHFRGLRNSLTLQDQDGRRRKGFRTGAGRDPAPSCASSATSPPNSRRISFIGTAQNYISLWQSISSGFFCRLRHGELDFRGGGRHRHCHECHAGECHGADSKRLACVARWALPRTISCGSFWRRASSSASSVESSASASASACALGSAQPPPVSRRRCRRGWPFWGVVDQFSAGYFLRHLSGREGVEARSRRRTAERLR